jgi:hypothetical protein
MGKTVFLALSLLAVAGMVTSQEQRAVDRPKAELSLAALYEDSQRWTSTVSAVDISGLMGIGHREVRRMEANQQACLETLKRLQKQINTPAEENTIRSQIAVLDDLSDTSECLSALQDSLEFRNSAERSKWEKWGEELMRAFEESTDDTRKMFVQMALLAEAKDSKIEPR